MHDSDISEICQLVDLLFLHTDDKRWLQAQALFIEGPMLVDMTSLVGGVPAQMSAAQLFSGFASGLHEKKVSHHMTSNTRVAVAQDSASVTAHGYALNCVPSMPSGQNTWETWGVYRIDARRADEGWRLASFGYFSRITRGPDAVRTHSL